MVIVARVGLIALFGIASIAGLVLVRWDAAVLFVAYGGAGVYLAIRRPTNGIGWLLVVMALGLALGSFKVTADLAELQAGSPDALGAATAWVYGWGWSLVMLGFAGIAFVYPSGRWPSGPWGQVGRAAVATIVLLTVLMAIGPTLAVLPAGSVDEAEVPNPLAFVLPPAASRLIPPPDVLFTLMSFAGLAGLVSMVARFRRSTGLERLQYRWLVAAVALVAVGTATWVILTQVLHFATQGGAQLIVLLTYPAVPIAIAIAVLRYRLYEINRIVSRTISYTLVTGVLAAVFAIAVVTLQTVLADVTQGDTLTVAASTLIAITLFQPLRRRIQAVVDRRFDRSAYDNARTSAAFSLRLGGQVELATVTAELDVTVRDVLAPTRVGIWLRAPDK